MAFVWRSSFWRALAYLAVLEALLAPAILFWPNFRDHAGALRSMAPKGFRGLVDSFMQGGVESYACGQHYFKACNTLGIAAAVLFAMGAVAGEVQRGTFEIWLARPVSRARLLGERWLAGALAVSLPIYLSSATIPWLLARVGESMSQADLLRCSTLEVALLLAVYSLTFLWSVVGRNPTRIAFAMFLLTIAQFALYLVKTATHFSLFRLADLEVFRGICMRDALPLGTLAGLAGVILASLALSFALFARRTP